MEQKGLDRCGRGFGGVIKKSREHLSAIIEFGEGSVGKSIHGWVIAIPKSGRPQKSNRLRSLYNMQLSVSGI
jgi:hypothetical protein